MIELAIMIEGQDGLNWTRWQKIARMVEQLGFAGLFRSDHYTNANPPDKDSLELWVSLTWLASHTRRIEFGPLVSPVSFRQPTMTARMAAAVDDLSGGRLNLGLGAGWQEREHENYGWDLLSIPERFERFTEGLEIITHLLRNPQPMTYDGRYYHLKDAVLLPRPNRPGGPRIVIGGNGMQRTLPLAARFADEWNGVYLTPEKFSEHNRWLDEILDSIGRARSEVRRTQMIGCVFGKNQSELNQRIEARTGGKSNVAELKQRGLIVGTLPEMVDQIGRLSEAGAQRLMLQWLDWEHLDDIEAIAHGLLST